jgi:sterol desaturase/sphingolipid hydroxylase (fatty acid hydroxylase superfamily)
MTFDIISALESSTAKTLAAVSYISLVLLEIYISRKKNQKIYETKDTILNLSLGTINSIIKLVTKGATVAFFYAIHQAFSLYEIPVNSGWGLLALFLLNDLTFYAYHRLSHESRLFWATHVTHHSSQIFNVSTALRGNFIHFFYRSVFWTPLAILGFNPILILLVDEIAFYYQMWIHTTTIGKTPRWFEFIFNTASHHRVHHASNQVYLDKNYGAILIIWDRIFGTFREEQEEVVYGLTKNIKRQDVTYVITHEFQQIWQDVKQAPDWKSRWRYVFGHPGWSHEKSS